MKLAQYRKTILAVVGAVVLTLSVSLGPDNPIVAAVISLATALGVYGVKNAPA